MDDNEYQRRYAADESKGPRERAPETEEQRAHRERWEAEALRERLSREAERRLEPMNTVEANTRMGTALRKLPRIVGATGMVRRTFLLREVADEVGATVAPHTICSRGCSHCCHQHVSLSEAEAIAIGRGIGRAPASVPECKSDYDINVATRERQHRYIGVPCTFLGPDGACTIYEQRPLACRMHFSLADSASWCSTERGMKVKDVPYFHNEALQLAIFRSFYGSDRADIREFFPPIPKEG